jgi:hypothetical protein
MTLDEIAREHVWFGRLTINGNHLTEPREKRRIQVLKEWEKAEMRMQKERSRRWESIRDTEGEEKAKEYVDALIREPHKRLVRRGRSQLAQSPG